MHAMPRSHLRSFRATRRARLFAAGWALLLAGAAGEAVADGVVEVCATTPDLGSLVREIGGEQVDVTVFVKSKEDPHFAEAKPGFVKATNGCELFVQNGLGLEVGYAPALLQAARNPELLPGNRGFLDASGAITPKGVPAGTVDRSMGDVHPHGNPHYLLDPLNGLAVAEKIAAKLTELRPASAGAFAARLAKFRDDLFRHLVGDDLARKYGAEVPKLATLFERGKLLPFLSGQGEAARLGGWFAAMAPHFGARAIQDHPIWLYFADRFGLRIVGSLEPRPGIPPTTKHMNEIVGLMQADGVRIVLASAYYDPRYARFVAEKSGARVLAMANQVGATAGADTYLEMIDHDVRQVAGALGSEG